MEPWKDLRLHSRFKLLANWQPGSLGIELIRLKFRERGRAPDRINPIQRATFSNNIFIRTEVAYGHEVFLTRDVLVNFQFHRRNAKSRKENLELQKDISYYRSDSGSAQTYFPDKSCRMHTAAIKEQTKNQKSINQEGIGLKACAERKPGARVGLSAEYLLSA